MIRFHADGRYFELSADDAALLRAAADRLTQNGIGGALREAQRIWAHVSVADAQNDAAAHTDFMTQVARRAAHEPMSHILGYRDFYDHRFVVTADVLDPRPDTETLVEIALAQPFDDVLDLGTGSGCILLSLLAARGQATGVGVDVSKAALAVAARNAENLALTDRVVLTQSDWFAAVDGPFDLIVSNPPYIAAREMADLQAEVRGFEPRIALTDEDDGLSCYRHIAATAPAFLRPEGRLLVEIGLTQGDAVQQMFRQAGFADVSLHRDLNGKDRVVGGILR